MSEKRVIKAINGPSEMGRALLPQDGRVTITYFGVFAETQYYSYVESITTINGNVSGGGTRTNSYESYDLGFGVENHSNVSMRVQFTIARKDNEGYSLGDTYTWVDVQPGEKRRAWSGFFIRDMRELKLYTLAEVGVGPTPQDPRNRATWSAASSPQKSIYDLLELESSLPRSMTGRGCLKVILIVMAIFFGLSLLPFLIAIAKKLLR